MSKKNGARIAILASATAALAAVGVAVFKKKQKEEIFREAELRAMEDLENMDCACGDGCECDCCECDSVENEESEACECDEVLEEMKELDSVGCACEDETKE